jgi:hypothetical protein
VAPEVVPAITAGVSVAKSIARKILGDNPAHPQSEYDTPQTAQKEGEPKEPAAPSGEPASPSKPLESAGVSGSGATPEAISTPYGDALQSDDPVAIAARAQVANGATLYRIGTIGQSHAAEAQFWSLENPANPGYAARYGIPAENVEHANFIETATLPPGTPFVTRPAPAVGANPGGGIEVVVPPGSVKMKYFSNQ